MLYKNILVVLSLSVGFLPMHGMYRADSSAKQVAMRKKMQAQQSIIPKKDQVTPEITNAEQPQDTWSNWLYKKFGKAEKTTSSYVQSIKDTVNSWNFGMKEIAFVTLAAGFIAAGYDKDALIKWISSIADQTKEYAQKAGQYAYPILQNNPTQVISTVSGVIGSGYAKYREKPEINVNQQQKEQNAKKLQPIAEIAQQDKASTNTSQSSTQQGQKTITEYFSPTSSEQ